MGLFSGHDQVRKVLIGVSCHEQLKNLRKVYEWSLPVMGRLESTFQGLGLVPLGLGLRFGLANFEITRTRVFFFVAG